MQIYVPAPKPPNYDRSQWTRKRDNAKLFNLVYEPLTALHGTKHDLWQHVTPGAWPERNPNPVWDAAAELCERRYDCYMRKDPPHTWPIK